MPKPPDQKQSVEQIDLTKPGTLETLIREHRQPHNVTTGTSGGQECFFCVVPPPGVDLRVAKIQGNMSCGFRYLSTEGKLLGKGSTETVIRDVNNPMTDIRARIRALTQQTA